MHPDLLVLLDLRRQTTERLVADGEGSFKIDESMCTAVGQEVDDVTCFLESTDDFGNPIPRLRAITVNPTKNLQEDSSATWAVC
jgi:hypothetical protein